jgi:hypothetical protein
MELNFLVSSEIFNPDGLDAVYNITSRSGNKGE